jgi:hypothetical protein
MAQWRNGNPFYYNPKSRLPVPYFRLPNFFPVLQHYSIESVFAVKVITLKNKSHETE